MLSIITITIGCLVAFAGDLEFDTVAYVAGLISVFAQAGYLTLVQKASAIEAALKNAEFQVIISNCHYILKCILLYIVAHIDTIYCISGSSLIRKENLQSKLIEISFRNDSY